jgi:ribosomal protein S25
MSNPYQHFSCQSSNHKTKSYKPKITAQEVINAVPKHGYITKKQIARKLGVSVSTIDRTLKEIKLGIEITMSTLMNKEQCFSRVRNDE